MKKVSILGANGTIGQIISNRLKERFDLKLFDIVPNRDLEIEKLDALNLEELNKNILYSDIVINLAWNIKGESHIENNYDASNFKMAANIFEACKMAKVPRLIVASSAHCHTLDLALKSPFASRIDISTPTNPSSFYGKDKVKIEKLGKLYSEFYEVVCVRFGAIEKTDMKFWNKTFGLTHADCIDLIAHISNLKKVKNKFQLIYGLSKNENSFINLKNKLSWTPKVDLTNFYKRKADF